MNLMKLQDYCGSIKIRGKNNHPPIINHHSRVVLRNRSSYPYSFNVNFTISVTTTKLWESNYSEYQQYLFDRICGYKENILTPNGSS